ncbi:thioredoxin 1 [Desulfuromusa kysingii]|uniref:Thioredoxin 1 n=1 Tax=Desulfuromusa kysingii TaxID=37625 RepID=A0A1H4DHH1_9BACT|nr:thioredoxin family protein [Desulfuromusa kysingii]SEA72205.1 thioredoxin 1 [Desulfuromusa kysingii]
MLKIIVLLITVLTLSGCSQEQTAPSSSSAPASEKEAKQTPSVAKAADYRLLFFINPDGDPCMMQENILHQMEPEWPDTVLVHPLKTTVSTDMDIFYAYGIRALPTIILVDSSGKEVSRLPPGVHAAATIRKLLKQIPGE